METKEETMQRIKEDAWKSINQRRKMGESFSDCIVRICDEHEQCDRNITKILKEQKEAEEKNGKPL